jgi:ABC-type dipeptide/oligopeptide/nickel transport system permease subunit
VAGRSGANDRVVMRPIDVMLAFPWLLLASGIMAILGPGIQNVVIAVAIVDAPAFAVSGAARRWRSRSRRTSRRRGPWGNRRAARGRARYGPKRRGAR